MDLSIRGVRQPQTVALFDVRDTDTDTQSHSQRELLMPYSLQLRKRRLKQPFLYRIVVLVLGLLAAHVAPTAYLMSALAASSFDLAHCILPPHFRSSPLLLLNEALSMWSQIRMKQTPHFGRRHTNCSSSSDKFG